MKYLLIKISWLIAMSSILLSSTYVIAQNDEMVRGNRKPKIWKRWKHKERFNKEPFNPYLKKKKKDLPSTQISKQNQREIRRQKKLARKQLKKNKAAYEKK